MIGISSVRTNTCSREASCFVVLSDKGRIDVAKILFDEPFTWLMGLGVVAIAGGVLLIEIGAS